ncbi:hypothetical protein EYR38_001676 [Pleurotus pulmonarius]|nr:hypothetical protein EYR38_001676 [Pleurotus pulmonarius]
MSSDSDWIRITSRDGFSFLAKRNVVNASGRLKNMLDTESKALLQVGNEFPIMGVSIDRRNLRHQSPDDPPANKRTLYSMDENERAYKCKRKADNVRLWNRRIDGETTKKRTHRPPHPTLRTRLRPSRPHIEGNQTKSPREHRTTRPRRDKYIPRPHTSHLHPTCVPYPRSITLNAGLSPTPRGITLDAALSPTRANQRKRKPKTKETQN